MVPKFRSTLKFFIEMPHWSMSQMSVIHRQVMPDLLGKMGNRLCLITNILLRKKKVCCYVCNHTTIYPLLTYQVSCNYKLQCKCEIPQLRNIRQFGKENHNRTSILPCFNVHLNSKMLIAIICYRKS